MSHWDEMKANPRLRVTTPMPPDQMSEDYKALWAIFECVDVGSEYDGYSINFADVAAWEILQKVIAAAQERGRKEENEACAKVAEKVFFEETSGDYWAGQIAERIRARVK
jgi:hypothetical protein